MWQDTSVLEDHAASIFRVKGILFLTEKKKRNWVDLDILITFLVVGFSASV
jgi:hypothetical protein